MADVKKVATRVSYGEALVELGNERDDFVVLDADLAAATQTGKFKAAHPERFYDAGIAEMLTWMNAMRVFLVEQNQILMKLQRVVLESLSLLV